MFIDLLHVEVEELSIYTQSLLLLSLHVWTNDFSDVHFNMLQAFLMLTLSIIIGYKATHL